MLNEMDLFSHNNVHFSKSNVCVMLQAKLDAELSSQSECRTKMMYKSKHSSERKARQMAALSCAVAASDAWFFQLMHSLVGLVCRGTL